jgi:hypothetical protein
MHSYASNNTVKTKFEYITAQDTDEETRMQRRQEQNSARAARRTAVLSD